MFAISNHRFPIWLPPAQLQSYWVNMMPNIFRWWNRITTLRDQACMQGANITSVFNVVTSSCLVISFGLSLWIFNLTLCPFVSSALQLCVNIVTVTLRSQENRPFLPCLLIAILALASGFGEAYLNISEDEFVLSTSATWCTAFKFAIQSQGKLVPCS